MSKFLQSYLLDGAGGGRSVDDDEIERWSPEQGCLWLHFDISDAGCGEWLQQSSGLPDTAIDALLASETRPQSTIFDNGLLIALRGVNTNPGADPEDMVSVRVWIERDRIISSRRRRLLSVQDIATAIDEGRGPTSPGSFLPALVERLADRIGVFVDSIEEQLDTAEDSTEEGNVSDVRSRLSSMRRQAASVRRFLAPQRDALDRLNRQSAPWLAEADLHELRQESDRITRYLEDLDLVRERAIVLQEELLGQIAQEQNARMYVLSVVAAVFLPLTFITGLLGMNVGGLPGLENNMGFAWSLVVMLVSAIGLVVYFRWRRWL